MPQFLIGETPKCPVKGNAREAGASGYACYSLEIHNVQYMLTLADIETVTERVINVSAKMKGPPEQQHRAPGIHG